MIDSHRFLSGQFDTRFVEERFSMADRDALDTLEAAILATLAAHQQGQQASQFAGAGSRHAASSNWKWAARWQRSGR
jgi:acetyl-CoA carboxylase biotin carboxylase subunit